MHQYVLSSFLRQAIARLFHSYSIRQIYDDGLLLAGLALVAESEFELAPTPEVGLVRGPTSAGEPASVALLVVASVALSAVASVAPALVWVLVSLALVWVLVSLAPVWVSAGPVWVLASAALALASVSVALALVLEPAQTD
jgi:hypothetical protein